MKRTLDRCFSLLLALLFALGMLTFAAPGIAVAEEPTIVTITEARALANPNAPTPTPPPNPTLVTIQGVVTVRDTQTNHGGATRGDTVVVQDETAGISVRLPQAVINDYSGTTFASQNIKIGDTITATGIVTVFNGLVQLAGAGAGLAGLAELDDNDGGDGTRPTGVPLDIADLAARGAELESQFVALTGDFEIATVTPGTQSGINTTITQGATTVSAKFLDENGNVLNTANDNLPLVGQWYTITGASVTRTSALPAAYALLVPSDCYVLTNTDKILPVSASPASGTVQDGTVVALSTATAGADIYYTTNGTEPTDASTKGTSVTLDFGAADTVVVKAIAIKDSMVNSNVTTFTYEKSTAPVSIAEANAMALDTRVAVEGLLTGFYDANTAYVQDGANATDGILVRMPRDNSLINQNIRASGYRNETFTIAQISGGTGSTGRNDPAAVTALGPAGAPLTPVPVRAPDFAPPRYRSMLVTLERVQVIEIGLAGQALNHKIDAGDALGANTLLVRGALPEGFEQGDWITIKRAHVYWFGSRNEIQLIAIDAAADIVKVDPPPETLDNEVIAEWRFGDVEFAPPWAPATGGTARESAKLTLMRDGAPTGSTAGGNIISGFVSVSATEFDKDQWWYAELSTENYINICVSFGPTSSGTGPGLMKVQYSADGVTWTDAYSPDYRTTPNDNTNNTYTKNEKAFPIGAEELDKLRIRWTKVTDLSLGHYSGSNPGQVIAAGGSNRLYDVVITGDFAPPEGFLRPPTASIPNGDIALNTIIDIVPFQPSDLAAPGYARLYRTSADGGATWSAWTAGASLAVTALPLELELKATADGDRESRVTSYSYTQSQSPPAFPSKASGPVLLPNTLALECDDYEATIKYTVNGGPEQIYADPISMTAALFAGTPGKLTLAAWSSRENYMDSDVQTFEYTVADLTGARVYFGQLHSHSTLSDGQGDPEVAYKYARDVAGLDFFALTDHSNSLGEPTTQNGDDPATIDLNTYNKDNEKWLRNHAAAAATHKDGSFVAIPSFEMTWSGGPGHINTFNTAGFVSRNNTALNNKSSFAGLQAYYELLERAPGSISMFNHPGDTFGNFNNFAFYNPLIGQRITLVEVGNGEGAIGSGGYFPSYEQYNLALEKGWFVGPTNNQDNHMGKWGDANTARTAIWTNDLTLEGVFQAFRDRRVYATEVADLNISYHVNGLPLGSIIEVLPASANFVAEIVNPTAGNFVKSASLISNGGKELELRNPGTQNYSYNATIDSPGPGYYYLRVVVGTPDGDRIACTAPVWLGKARSAGFNSVERSAAYPVTTEPLTITAELFNGEKRAAALKSIKFEETDINGATRDLGAPSDANGTGIPANGALRKLLTFTPSVPGDFAVTVTAVIAFEDGEEKTYTYTIEYEVLDITKMVFLGIDGSHFNEYAALTGTSYSNNMTNTSAVAARFGVRAVTLSTEEALIEALGNEQYMAFIFTTPGRRTPSTPETVLDYSPAALAAIKGFSERGGTLVVTGWNNLYESYEPLDSLPFERLMSSQQNQLLASVGSTLRIARDGAADRDDENPANVGNGGPGSNNYWPEAANQPHRLFPTGLEPHFGYDTSHPLLAGVEPVQRYSQYGGTTVYAVASGNAGNWQAAASAALPPTVSRAVSLPPGARSLYRGNPLHNNTPGYPLIASSEYTKDGRQQYMILASETLDRGNGVTSEVIAAGGAFMSNFEIRTAEPDNIADLYSNQNIIENIIKSIAPEPELTPIADVKALPNGMRVIVEGTVTSNVYVPGEANTGFFDCIYIQDESGNGVNLHPISSGVKEGQLIRVYGRVSSYQGEAQVGLVYRVEVIDSSINKIAPDSSLTTAQSMLPANTGKLVSETGVVSNVVKTGDAVAQFTVDDGSGPALIYINAYITSGVSLPFVENGATVKATGLASIGENMSSNDPLPRIRVRDRSEIVLVSPPKTDPGGGAGHPAPTPIPVNESLPKADVAPTVPGAAVQDAAEKAVEDFDEAWAGDVKSVGEAIVVVLPKSEPTVVTLDGLPESIVVQDVTTMAILNADGTLTPVPTRIVDGKIIVVLEMDATLVPLSVHAAFSDLQHVAAHVRNEINLAASLLIVEGFPDGEFKPGDKVTTQQAVAMLLRACGIKVDYATAMATGVASKLIGDGLTADAPMTRIQTAEMLVNALSHFGLHYAPTEEEISALLEKFPDVGGLSAAEREALAITVKLGIFQGHQNGNMEPNGILNRSQLASLAIRMQNVLFGMN